MLQIISKLGMKVQTEYQQGDLVHYNNHEFQSFYQDILPKPPNMIGQVVGIKKNKKDVVGKQFYETTVKVVRSQNEGINGSLLTEPSQLFSKV